MNTDVRIVEQWAGHYNDCSDGKDHDKIWSAAYTNSAVYMAAWGRRGIARLQHQEIPGVGMRKYNAMISEKIAKGYKAIPFDDKRYGVPSFDPTFKPAAVALSIALMQATRSTDKLVSMLLSNNGWGITERVEGDRRLLVRSGKQAQVYSAKNGKMTLVEDGIMGFNALGCDYTLEYVKTPDNRTVITDVHSFGGYDIRTCDYKTRLGILESNLIAAKLITKAGPFSDPTQPISLLTPVESGHDWQTLVAQAKQTGKSGVVLHALDAAYTEGESPFLHELVF
jgi:hypothetical protein